eukprot:m.93987 g.93987  ORF g.93987 m.93987 type:complete len:70 (+) comp36807_c0_seq31:1779-1988(+)
MATTLTPDRRLLEGFSFYITASVKPSLSQMRVIIEAAGGKILTSPPSVEEMQMHRVNVRLSVCFRRDSS